MSSVSGEASGFGPMGNSYEQQKAVVKKKRNLPGTPDPHAEVIALSPKTLMATNRFVCEVCGKGFQRDQNLQLHRRGHNLPWKLKQREGQEIRKRVYVCPEATCVHHDPSRALGDLTGIKKHFSRKHGEKKWKCDKCSKRYAVQSDWKAHQKICGTREYQCDCGTLFSRRDSFITHRAFCDALAEESARVSAHRQVETQQSGGHDGNALTGPAGELSSPMENPSSPLSQLANGLPDAEVSKPPVREDFRPNFALNEGEISPLTSRWAENGIGVKSYKPSKGPGLSLCLGTGPGPGPPGALQMLGCPPQTDGRLPFRGMSKAGGLGSENDETMQWPSSSAGVGMFTSMLTSANSGSEPQGYAVGQHASNGMAGLSTAMVGSCVSRFASPAGRISNANYFGSAKSCHNHQQHTGSAPMPATALLQKAAMMGATASNPSLFRNFRLGADSSSMAPGGPQQDSWAGITSSWPAFLNATTAAGCHRLDRGHGYGAHEAGDSIYPALYGGQGSVQEFMDSLCGGGAALFESTSNVMSYPVNNARDFIQDSNQHHDMLGQSDLLNGGSKVQDGATQAGLGGPQGGDKHEGDRTTLDLLGVGGPSGKVGAAAGMGRTLSQRDISSITSLSAGIKVESTTHYKDNRQARGEGRHSSDS